MDKPLPTYFMLKDLFHAQNITADLKRSNTQWHIFAEAPTITAAPSLHVKVLSVLKTCHDCSHALEKNMILYE